MLLPTVLLHECPELRACHNASTTQKALADRLRPWVKQVYGSSQTRISLLPVVILKLNLQKRCWDTIHFTRRSGWARHRFTRRIPRASSLRKGWDMNEIVAISYRARFPIIHTPSNGHLRIESAGHNMRYPIFQVVIASWKPSNNTKSFDYPRDDGFRSGLSLSTMQSESSEARE